MNLMVLDIFNKLKNESSRTGKEKILKDNKDNKEFVSILELVYNPYIVTGISTKKIKKNVVLANLKADIYDINSMISYLKINNSGKDLDISAIKGYLLSLDSEEEKELVKQIVTKDLKVGITSKTINKVYGEGFIPSFSVMLAESYFKKPKSLKGYYYITQKLDGNRCLVTKDENGKITFFTRKGQEIEGMNELAKEFELLPNNYAYDGELLLINKDNLPSDELFRETQKVVRKNGEKKGLVFNMFDFVPLDEFKLGKSKNTYEYRRNQLDTWISILIHDSKLISVLPVLYYGDDKEKIIELMNTIVKENNWEGLMINSADGLYESKRSKDLLKVKQFITADLLCVSTEIAESGEFKGLIGRINVDYKGNTVGVGSGFTVEQRKYLTEHTDEIIGKIVEVQYFEESQDSKTEQYSLRFPVFKGIREDKGIEDINYN